MMTPTDTPTPAARLLAKVAEAEALAEKATPGPWEVEKEVYPLNELGNKEREGCEDTWTYVEHPVYRVQTCWEHGQVRAKLWIAGESYSPYFEGDKRKLLWNTEPGDPEFIAASRTLVPQLAAALRECVTALELYDDPLAPVMLARAAAAMGDGDD